MPRIENAIEIDRSPDDVWAVLGDLEGVSAWVPEIAAVRVEGRLRVCTLAGGAGEIHEEIDRDGPRRSFHHRQTVHPLGLRRSEGVFVVEPANGGSRVVWEAEVELPDPGREAQVLPLLEHGYRAALAGLKALVER
jgi:carbon monoxide dehydrogenase subunit G